MRKKIINKSKAFGVESIKILFVLSIGFLLFRLSHCGHWKAPKIKDFSSYCKSVHGLRKDYFMSEIQNLEEIRLIVKNEWREGVQESNLDFLRKTMLKDFSDSKFEEVKTKLTFPNEDGQSAISVEEEEIDGKLFLFIGFYGMGGIPKDDFDNMINVYKEYINKVKHGDTKYFKKLDNDYGLYMFCLYGGLYTFYDGLYVSTLDFFGHGYTEKIVFK